MATARLQGFVWWMLDIIGCEKVCNRWNGTVRKEAPALLLCNSQILDILRTDNCMDLCVFSQ